MHIYSYNCYKELYKIGTIITHFTDENTEVYTTCVCECVYCMLSHVQLSVTPWTVAHQTPLSIAFSRQEHWNGLPFPPSEHLPDPGTQSMSPALEVDSLLFDPPRKPVLYIMA